MTGSSFATAALVQKKMSRKRIDSGAGTKEKKYTPIF
jgi:hypothetical protein